MGNVLILRNALKGGGGLDFFAEPYTVEGICSVLLYVTEWEGSKKQILYYVIKERSLCTLEKTLEQRSQYLIASQSDSKQFRPENPLEVTGKMFQNSGFITSHLRIFRNFLRCKVMNPKCEILEHFPREFTRILRADSGRNCSESNWV
jgi:hypothetical protein